MTNRETTAAHSGFKTTRNVLPSIIREIRSIVRASKIYANAKIEKLKLKYKLGFIALIIACTLVAVGPVLLFSGLLILFTVELPASTTTLIAIGTTLFGALLLGVGVIAYARIARSVQDLRKIVLKEDKALDITKKLAGRLYSESKELVSPNYWFKNHPIIVVGSILALGGLMRKPLSNGIATSFKTSKKYLFGLVTTTVAAAVVDQIQKELSSDRKESLKSESIIH